MTGRVIWKIAAPMIGLGILLLLLGAFAAYKVNEGQRATAEMVTRQAHAMLTVHELYIVIRDIRYNLNRFLVTGEPQYLRKVNSLHASADTMLAQAKQVIYAHDQQQLDPAVETGYRSFFQAYSSIMRSAGIDPAPPVGPDAAETTIQLPDEVTAALGRMSDEQLTTRALRPLEQLLADNRRWVLQSNEVTQATAQRLKVGFLLLGTCGALAGLLMGVAIARGISRSIVQLDVSVQSVAGRLSSLVGPVIVSRTGELSDIDTSLRKLEGDIADIVERLHQREAELLRSEQLAKVGQLAAGVAHELRNPLMPVKLLVQAALERQDDGGLSGRSLQVVNEEIIRLEQSIQSFLDYARPPTPTKDVVDLREVLNDTIRLVSGRARQQDVKFDLDIPAEPILANVDRTQMRQLFLNVLLNALDVLPNGGTIECVVACPADDRFERIPIAAAASAVWPRGLPTKVGPQAGVSPLDSSKSGEFIAISIADNGPGISSDAVDVVFEPFTTTKETGMGLGLSICRRIAAAHEGRLTVRNRPSGGAEFTLVLPKY